MTPSVEKLLKKEALTEGEMASLFGSYGAVLGTVLYSDRRTGRRKGDGLVVYRMPPAGPGAAQDLVRAVCRQMNGAELGSGGRISVEPADADYGNKRAGKGEGEGNRAPAHDVGYLGPAPAAAAAAAAAGALGTVQNSGTDQIADVGNAKETVPGGDADGGKEQREGDDLDDFFESL